MIPLDYNGTMEWDGYCAAKAANVMVTRMFAAAESFEHHVIKFCCGNLSVTRQKLCVSEHKELFNQPRLGRHQDVCRQNRGD